MNRIESQRAALIVGNAYGLGDLLEERFAAEDVAVTRIEGGNEEEGLEEWLASGRGLDYVAVVTDEYREIPFLQSDADDWNRGFRLYLRDTFRLVRRLTPKLFGQASGSVVFLSSPASRAGAPGAAIYAAAKGGLLGFVRSFALEAAKFGVRVNLVSAAKEGDVAQPQEVADAMLFLLREESSFITGQDVMAEGGVL